jgi:hypothetical protein
MDQIKQDIVDQAAPTKIFPLKPGPRYHLPLTRQEHFLRRKTTEKRNSQHSLDKQKNPIKRSWTKYSLFSRHEMLSPGRVSKIFTWRQPSIIPRQTAHETCFEARINLFISLWNSIHIKVTLTMIMFGKKCLTITWFECLSLSCFRNIWASNFESQAKIPLWQSGLCCLLRRRKGYNVDIWTKNQGETLNSEEEPCKAGTPWGIEGSLRSHLRLSLLWELLLGWIGSSVRGK